MSSYYTVSCSQCKWHVVSEVYIPKSKPPNPSNIKHFPPVALLNIGGKIFFSLASRKIEDHIIFKNKIINFSIQKGTYAGNICLWCGVN